MFKHCPIIVAFSGFVVLAVGILCTWYGFPKLVKMQIDQNIAIQEGTNAFEMWQKQSFPLSYKIYFFNVTNPAAVMGGDKPILKEIGPYIYNIYIERQIIKIDEKTDTIQYHLKKHYVFNTTASGCRNDDDVVTVINMALMGTALKVHGMFPAMLSLVYSALPYLYPGISDVFLRAKVKDILFNGITLYCSAPEIESICMMMKAAQPASMKLSENGQDFIFSLFGAYNDTLLGPFNMTRGLTNTTRGELLSYKDEEELDFWDDGVCNMINGSDSGLFFPMKEPTDKLYTFIPEVCRSVAVDFEKKVELHGIQFYRYASTEAALSHSGPNKCFCDQVDDNEYECPAEADKKLLDYADGLKPVQDLHESLLIIEPKTATPLKGAKRTQMNVEMKQIKNFPLLENVSEGVFPILWIEEGADLPEDLVKLLADSFTKMAALEYIKWILIIGGIVLMLVSFGLVIYQEKLMCFSNSGKAKLNEGAIFTTRNSSLPPINTSMVYPRDSINLTECFNANVNNQNDRSVDQRVQNVVL
ncbi:hypothetical protein Trydic_g7690 [Trypoxylus dichotomus]